MINLKRLLNMIMISVALTSLFLVGAIAVFPDQDKIENETAVNMSVALKIIQGRDDGKFDPQGTATRAEMAKMICIILNGGNEPIWAIKPTSSFRDVKGHWAEAYIEYCTQMGIVAGMGDGSFNPNGKVTGTQAAKMLLVALGYDAAYEGFNGANWSFKINMAAYQKHLYDELQIDPNAPLERDDAAQMIWNALSATMVKYTYGLQQSIKGAGEYSDKRTLISDRYSPAYFEGQMSKFSYNPVKKEWTYEIVNAASNPAIMTVSSALDYTSLYGQSARVVYKQNGTEVDKLYGIYAPESRALFSGALNDLTISSDSIKCDGITYYLDKGTAAETKVHAFTYDSAFHLNNGTALNALTAAQKTHSFTAIDDDNDGKVDFLLSYPYTVQKVSFVGTETITVGTSYLLKDCDVYDGIARDDYTKMTQAANTANGKTRMEPVDKVSGTVTKVRGSDYYIDGNRYVLADGVTMAVGDTVKDAVVINHVIFAAKVSHLTIEDYALVMDAVASGANGLFGHQAKMLFTDGTKMIVSTDKSYVDLKGQMVTCERNRDDEYELIRVDYSSAVGTCFDKAIPSGYGKISSSSNSNMVKYIDGCSIDGDAEIFVREGDGSAEKPFVYKIISGSTLMSVNKTGVSLNGAFADHSSSGYDTVKLAYISSTDQLTYANRQYGYAVADYAQVKNSDNETVYEYTLWNGSKEITVLAKHGLQTAVYAGDVVAYTINPDGAIDQMSVYATKGTNPAAEVVAITAYDGTQIQYNGGATSYQINMNRTKIIYIHNRDGTGVESGAIQLAQKDGNGTDCPNALVLTDGNEVSLIVVDVTNVMGS